MKPEDAARYAQEAWANGRQRDFDEEIAGYPFPVAGCSVLDLAAGPGAFTAALIRAGASRVVWQDVDPTFLAVAGGHLPEPVEMRVADMMDLDDPDATFDVVFLRDALHWAADEGVLLRRIARVTRGGGWLVVTNHNWRRPLATVRPRWRAAAHMATPLLPLVLQRKPLPTLWVFERLTRRRLRGAGFDVDEWRRPNCRHFVAVCRKK